MAEKRKRFDVVEALVWTVAAATLLPLVFIGLIPLVLVLGVFWPVMILPVIGASQYRGRYIHEHEHREEDVVLPHPRRQMPSHA
ncbi:MAG: hypothetical protein KC776_07930 [Myxococcales bacterium]|nr:hypothetical protein [Myxococcales bacterium]MCB9577100.1 hypothetical protein [Polyangiaceae bacterium]